MPKFYVNAKFLIASVVLVFLFSSVHAETEFTPKLKSALAVMKIESEKLGKPSFGETEKELLFFGTTQINGNFQIVDVIKEKFGCTSTFFVRKGDSFIRVSTNVIKDGNRAVGTPLDPLGPAIAAIRKGEAYYGIVDILDKLYDTIYEPVKNEKGDVIGIYYVGQALE